MPTLETDIIIGGNAMNRSGIAAAAILLLPLAACSVKGSAGPTASQYGGRYAGQLYVEVGVLNSPVYSYDDSYDHKEGLRRVGEELGVKTEYTGPPDFDMKAVAAAIEEAVARKAAGIVVVGWEESLSAAVDKAVDSGVPVVTVGMDLPSSKRCAFVGTSDFNAGVALGRYVAGKLEGRGSVALVGSPDLAGVRDRIDGVQSAFAGTRIKVVQIGDPGADAAGAAKTAAAILRKYPELAALLGLDSDSGRGIAEEVRQAGRAGRLVATGFDRDNRLLELVEAGVVTATVVPRAVLMPYYAVLILWQLQNSEVSMTADDRAAGIKSFPSFVDTGVLIVERDQARVFVRKN
jgi:ribose transport system substrate-binding protein